MHLNVFALVFAIAIALTSVVLGRGNSL